MFEFQIMPQLFDILKELMLVDWSTIAFYTCSNRNKPCYPDSSNSFIEEYAFVQFADDFARV